MMPSLDRSFSALIEDMDGRGLLDETLVCFVTEMGRTSRINKNGGLDHWSRAMSIAFAGAGVPGGAVIGATDKESGDVVESLYTPYDYAETIYRKLGIGPEQRLEKPGGLMVPLSDGGRIIRELVRETPSTRFLSACNHKSIAAPGAEPPPSSWEPLF